MNRPDRLDKLSIRGSKRSSQVKRLIDQNRYANPQWLRLHIINELDLRVPMKAITRYRDGITNCCKICGTTYYASELMETCSEQCRLMDSRPPSEWSMHTGRVRRKDGYYAEPIYRPLNLVQLRSIANTCTDGWLYSQKGRVTL